LQKLIASHDFLSVVAKACELLCGICAFSSATSHFVVKLMRSILEGLEEHTLATSGAMPDSQRTSIYLRRRLFVLGHLWRNSRSIAENTDSAVSSELQSILSRTRDAILYWLVDSTGGGLGNDGSGQAASKRATHPSIAMEALRALGMLIYGHESVALHDRVKEVYALHLGVATHPSLQVCALRGLTDMIKKEEASIIEKQQRQLKENNTTKKRTKSHPASTAALNTVCGEGEVSIAGTVLRHFWDEFILPLAMHIRRAGGDPASGMSALDSLVLSNRPVKLALMDLFETVLRQGLVAPWTAVPALVALCAYPDAAVHQQACQILKNYILEKRLDFFESKLIDAIQSLFELSFDISAQCGSLQSSSGKVLTEEMMEGLCMLYKILAVKRQTRVSFLKVLTRVFAKAFSGSAYGSKEGGDAPADGIDLNLLAFSSNLCISLPYKYVEEPLQLIHSCNSLVCQEASYVESSLELMSKHSEDIKAGKSVPFDLKLIGQKAASISLLLEVKRVLRKVYSISDNQIANYSEKQGKSSKDLRAVKCKAAAAPGTMVALSLETFSGVDINSEEHSWVSQCKTFKKLMKQDAASSYTRYVPKAQQSPCSETTNLTSDMTTPSSISMGDRYSPGGGRGSRYGAGETPQSAAMPMRRNPSRRVPPKRKLMDAFNG